MPKSKSSKRHYHWRQSRSWTNMELDKSKKLKQEIKRPYEFIVWVGANANRFVNPIFTSLTNRRRSQIKYWKYFKQIKWYS